jgi:hypothetical protein
MSHRQLIRTVRHDVLDSYYTIDCWFNTKTDKNGNNIWDYEVRHFNINGEQILGRSCHRSVAAAEKAGTSCCKRIQAKGVHRLSPEAALAGNFGIRIA